MKQIAVSIARLIKTRYPQVDESEIQKIVITAFAYSPVADFFTDCVVLEPSHDEFVSDVYAAYKQWCGVRGISPLGRNKFNRDMCNLGARKIRIAPGYVFRNLKLTVPGI